MSTVTSGSINMQPTGNFLDQLRTLAAKPEQPKQEPLEQMVDETAITPDEARAMTRTGLEKHVVFLDHTQRTFTKLIDQNYETVDQMKLAMSLVVVTTNIGLMALAMESYV